MKERKPYEPPAHFQRVENLPALVQEAANENTELWLIRIPGNEIGPRDLMQKTLNIDVNASDGNLGHFFNVKGQEYTIHKPGNVKGIQPYAIIPNGQDQPVVRKLAHQVSFLRSQSVKGVDSRKEDTPPLLKDVGAALEEQTGAILSIDYPSKKKRQRSKPSEETSRLAKISGDGPSVRAMFLGLRGI